MLLILLANIYICICIAKLLEVDSNGLNLLKSEHTNVLVYIYDGESIFSNRCIDDINKVSYILEDQVVFAKLDINTLDNDNILNEHSIIGLPAIVLFHHGQYIYYNGITKSEHITEWILKYLNTSVAVVHSREEVIGNKSTTMISFCGDLDGYNKEYSIFCNVADMHRELGMYFAYECEGSSTVEIIRPNGTFATLSDITSADRLVHFILRERLGYLLILDESILVNPLLNEDYTVVYFGGSPKHLNLYKSILENIGRIYKDDIVFAYLDVQYWRRQAPWVQSCCPCLFNIQKFGRYRLQGEDNMNDIEINRWISDLLTNNLEVQFQSEDEPETNYEPVKIVVSKNFTEIVSDDKDVLLYIYAPWCSICKQYDILFNDIASVLADTRPNCVVAKINGDSNEIDEDIYPYKSYPTIYFKPAGGLPILYTKERTQKELIRFVDKQYGLK